MKPICNLLGKKIWELEMTSPNIKIVLGPSHIETRHSTGTYMNGEDEEEKNRSSDGVH